MKKKTRKMSTNEADFSDYKGITRGGWIDPSTGKPFLEDELKSVARSHTLDSKKLQELVRVYTIALKEKSPQESLKDFFKHANKRIDLSDSERLRLKDALEGDLEAVQDLVRANPDVIRLPFIADALIKILREYKYSPIRYDKDDKKGIVKRTLPDIRNDWNKMLSSREGNKIPYRDEDLEFSIEKAKEAGIKNPSATVADHLKISPQALRKVAPTKKGPGRLKKAGKDK